jgi:HEAT repeats/PBS lyase HEAT-like repeat
MMKSTAILLTLLLFPVLVHADGFHSPLVRGGDPQRWAQTLRDRLGIDQSDSAEGRGARIRPDPALVGQLADVLRYLDKKNVLLSEFPDFNYDDLDEFKSETEALLIAIGADAVPLLVDTLVRDLKGVGGIQGLSRSKDFNERLVRILIAIGEDSIGRVVAALAEPHPDVRKTMLRILKGIVLDPDFGSDVEGWRKWYVIFSAGRRKSPASVADVLPYLTDEDRRLRLEAIRTLGRIGSKKAVPGLLAALNRATTIPIRIEIVRALGRLGDILAVPDLIHLLNASSPTMREEAVTALRFLTHEMMGFEPGGPVEKRAEAVRRWLRWWERKISGK